MPLDEFCQKYYKNIVEDLQKNKSNFILDSAIRATEEATKDLYIKNQSKVLNKIEKYR